MTAARDPAAEARQREQRRQQSLLRALAGDGRSGGGMGGDIGGVGRAALSGWTHQPVRARHTLERGLAAYLANAAALAERSLAARYPTVQTLVGAESFALLARHLWQAEPAERGDLAQWGHGLPAFIAASAQLASEPYLADVARLDAACADAESAADAEPQLDTLAALASEAPDRLQLRLAAGTALLDSAHPLVEIWHAHHAVDPAARSDPFAPVREEMARSAAHAEGAAEPFQTVLVWRAGWQARVQALEPTARAFMAALLAGADLATALDRAAADFDFEAWLLQALRDEQLVGLSVLS
ncbi:MAG: putative DNA-binding domain-containing protein [Leptothrix sp. (in: b-proteobacteria)]